MLLSVSSLYYREGLSRERAAHSRTFIIALVNPEISSGLPIPELNRNPAPASRPELYATPATEASDIAFNPVRQSL
jgi:hypothetical protein